MPKNRNVDPPFKICICLPTSLKARMDAFLYSQVDSRVPYGARSDLIAGLIENYLDIVAPEDLGPEDEG